MFRSIALLLAAMWFATVAVADTLKSESDLRGFGDRVMGTMTKNGIGAAFEAMKRYVVIPESEFQSMSLASKSQRDQFGVRYGKTIGFEFISQSKVGESLVKLTYIEKTEKHALPWSFYFYKTPAGWALNSFSWSDRMPQLFHD